MTMSTSRFRSLTPQRSLRRLKTALSGAERNCSTSSDSTSSPLSTTTSASSRDIHTYQHNLNTSTMTLPVQAYGSPDQQDLTPISPWSRRPTTPSMSSPQVPQPWNPDTWDEYSYSPIQEQRPFGRGNSKRVIRRKKSIVEMQQQEEREHVRADLLGLTEPRPQTGVAQGGIEEILAGRA